MCGNGGRKRYCDLLSYEAWLSAAADTFDQGRPSHCLTIAITVLNAHGKFALPAILETDCMNAKVQA